MTLRKITVDNSVRNVPKTEQTKAKTTKVGSLPRKQNKKLSQNKKKWVALGFGILKIITNCYF